MRTGINSFAAAILLANVGSTLAAVRYVDVNSTNATQPYLSWATAASNIQEAVDAAVAGDEIMVANGIYATGGRTLDGVTTNRVAVDKPLKLRSVNGPQLTIVDGGASVRCVYLVTSASLSGFTVTNGATICGGAGVFCEDRNAVVTNCVVANNSLVILQQGTNQHGGGVFGGTLDNCTIIANSAGSHHEAASYGGGACDSTLNNCALSGNSATDGGGVFACELNTCTLSGNSAHSGGGASRSTLNNCVLNGNSTFFDFNAGISGDPGGGASICTLNNCTLTGNSTTGRGIPIAGGGAYQCTLNSCILFTNTSNTGCQGCGAGQLLNGNNWSGDPLFVDYASGNLRLQSNSPCINAGNNAYAVGSTDLEGNPRIFRGTVDIGAYEFQGPGSVISYAWLQQYNLPTDGSADYTDPDGDHMNNWQEWRCGTDPTDALSTLRLLSSTGNVSGVIVSWQSVSNRMYFLERSSNLGVVPPFSLLATNIAGQPGTTTYTDTNAVGAGPFFYRVGVQE